MYFQREPETRALQKLQVCVCPMMAVPTNALENAPNLPDLFINDSVPAVVAATCTIALGHWAVQCTVVQHVNHRNDCILCHALSPQHHVRACWVVCMVEWRGFVRVEKRGRAHRLRSAEASRSRNLVSAACSSTASCRYCVIFELTSSLV